MKKFGIYLIVFGVGSFILNQFGMEFRLLSWIDSWGDSTALLIRGGMILAGGGLALAGHLTDDKVAA
jgi:hypothetical protein